MIADSAVIRDLAPCGHMRIGLNLGNPSVVTREGNDFRGIAVDLSRSLEKELGLPVQFVSFGSAGQLLDAAARDAWDVAFLAIDDQRREQLAFTGPYMQIQAQYMVRADSPIEDPEELDSPGIRVAVTAGSAYDAYLTSHLKQASLERHTTSTESFFALMQGGVDAAAGVGLALRNFAARQSGVRILDQPFMAINHGLAIPKERAAGAAYLTHFIARQFDPMRMGNEERK